MESVNNGNKPEGFQKDTLCDGVCNQCNSKIPYFSTPPITNTKQPESYEETFHYSVQVTTEDVIDRLYVVSASMPDKTFIDVFDKIFGGSGRFPSNNVETLKIIDYFIKANKINSDIDTPNEKLDTLSYRLIDDLDIIETNVSYCLRNKRYLEAEKEISCHKTISSILDELLPKNETDVVKEHSPV